MSTISEYSHFAELAFASYSNLTSGISGKNFTDALERGGSGMAPIQSQTFADSWRVLDQYDGLVEETYVDEFGQDRLS